MKRITAIFLLVTAAMPVFSQIGKGTVSLGGGLGFDASGNNRISISGYTNPASASSNRSTDGSAGLLFTINASAGYFIKDNMEIGILAAFGSATATTPKSFDKTTGTVSDVPEVPGVNTVLFDNKTSQLYWGGYLYANWYHAIGTTAKWYWYIQASAGYVQATNSITEVYAYDPGSQGTIPRPKQYRSREIDFALNPNTHSAALGVAPGIRYFISPRWAAGMRTGNLLQVNYTYSTYSYTTYINNNNANTYPGDVDAITTKTTGYALSARAQLPFITSGDLQLTLGYFIR